MYGSPAITSGPPPAATTGTAYAFTVTATGSPAPTFAVTAGVLPDGLGLDPATGVISGTPTTTGTASFTITAANGIDPDATAAYTLTVYGSPQTIMFGTEAPADAVVGGRYTPTATATSGLPVTISLDPSSAGACTLETGVVAFIGAGSCVISATQPGDSTWQPAPQVQQAIDVVGVAPQITVSGSGSFTVSTPGSVTFSGTGTPTPTLSESGALPAGLSFSVGPDGRASISGTPQPGTAGSYQAVVSAVSAAGHTSVTVTITVARVPTTLSIHGPSNATTGSAVILSATVTGGDPLRACQYSTRAVLGLRV